MTTTDEKGHMGESEIPGVPADWLNLTSDNIGEGTQVDMGALLKANVAEHTERQLITGRVVAITPTDILIDVGLKSEGVVPREEFTNPRGEVMVAPGTWWRCSSNAWRTPTGTWCSASPRLRR